MKKIVTLFLAVVMLISVMTVAVSEGSAVLSTKEEDKGIAGAWETADTPIPQPDKVIIKKELVAYNATSDTVFAPAFSYTYTVEPATVSNLTITDDSNDHSVGVSVVAPVKPGITAGLKVNGGDEGTAQKAVGTLVFTNAEADKLDTSASGEINEYDITLDFSGVGFAEPGVYRYKITEAADYDNIAIKDGGSNERYLDVYVDGDLKIYGYVCMAENASVTNTTEKTNGFVADSEGQDEYYTYDLTISKTVENDTYAKNNHKFPFTVIFNNNENYTATYTITETVGTGSEGITPAAASAPTWSGVALVKDGGEITYTGIPAGVDVDVYETNDVTGTTYTVSTVVNGGTAVVDNSVSWGTAPDSAVAQSDQKAYETKKATVDTTKTTAVAAEQTVAITNTLLQISPTGVVVRVAPYVLILAAGIALLLIGRRRRHTAKD